MGITQTAIDSLFSTFDKIDLAEEGVRKKIANDVFRLGVRDLAGTIYHESRHCQQTFWMLSLYGTFPDDYKEFPGMGTMFSYAIKEKIKKIASNEIFPNDSLARVGVHRMLIFYYWWFIQDVKNNNKDFVPYAPILADEQKVLSAVCQLRGVTPEQAVKMGQRNEPGYYTHYHEEDAYATEDAVKQYWDDPDHASVLTPGICTSHYEGALSEIGVNGNG